MRITKYQYYVADFETTTYDNQEITEVWASACVEMYTEDVKIFHSIEEQFNYFLSLNRNICVFFHNLKFDGSFWLSFLMTDLGFTQAYIQDDEDINSFRFLPKKNMKNNTFTYSISSMGQWYRIIIKVNNKIIEIRDSLKLLPFSVKKIGESFKTKHKKLDMEYKGFRYAGCEITDREKEYIKNDVLVVKEALEILFNEGHNRLTIGSCCLSEFKKSIGGKIYDRLFPDVYKIETPFNNISVGEYIKRSYHGGWCYLVKGKEKKIYKDGVTADVNSLYPSVMSSESRNRYPVGEPTFWTGNFIPKEALKKSKYYFVRIRTRFYIKHGKLPFIQIKNNLMYKPREMLETSDIYNYKTRKYEPYYYDLNGQLKEARVEMVMTMTDFQLFKEHYNLVDFEIIDGCYFRAVIGIFDNYIEKYKKIKMESYGAVRELAKLFLNNLYGKMASSPNSDFKVAFVKEDKSIGFYSVISNDKKAGYIPVGSAITSYARDFTIRAAQLNYHGVNSDGFIYADTDSIHCNLNSNDLKGIKVDNKKFCCWNIESCWDKAIFIRPKTYIEHNTHEELKMLEKPYFNIKCAGMPPKCKELFLNSMSGKYIYYNGLTEDEKEYFKKLSKDEQNFVKQKRNLKDFDIGLVVPGKLIPKRIKGGVVLNETTYEMR